MYKCDVVHVTLISFKHIAEFMKQLSDSAIYSFLSYFSFPSRLQEMEILYKKEKEEADLLLEQQRLVGVHPESSVRKRAACFHITPSLFHRRALAQLLLQLSLIPYAILSFPSWRRNLHPPVALA